MFAGRLDKAFAGSIIICAGRNAQKDGKPGFFQTILSR
jgi:hypothetical protein